MFRPQILTIFVSLLIGGGIGFLGGIQWSAAISKFWATTQQVQTQSTREYEQPQTISASGVATLATEVVASEVAPTIIEQSKTELTYINTEASFTGEDLLQAVNEYRRERGINELELHSDLCQLSSRRLGQLIEQGKLDNHSGFEEYFEDHSLVDMGLQNVAENLASGYDTAEGVVEGWNSSPPHRAFLLADVSYRYGCTSANLGFGVLIAGY